MSNAIDTAAIESLRTFALAHNEPEFAHLCTAALSGEEWAVERITETIQKIEDAHFANGLSPVIGCTSYALEIIRTTDTTRPDGLVARSLLAP